MKNGYDRIRSKLVNNMLLNGSVRLCGAIASEVVATLSLKGAIYCYWLYAVVIFGYLFAFLMLSSALKCGIPLGVAYGVWSAMGVVFAVFFSFIMFGEPISTVAAFGVLLIVVGVFLVEIGSKRPDDGHMFDNMAKEEN